MFRRFTTTAKLTLKTDLKTAIHKNGGAGFDAGFKTRTQNNAKNTDSRKRKPPGVFI